MGRPIINGGALRIGAGSTGAGDFSMRGTSTLAGDIAPAQTVRANAAGATATLTAAAGFTNAGVLELQTITAAANVPSNLTVTAGTLTNSGTLRTLKDAFSGSGRTIAANLLNTGTVEIGTTTTFSKQNGAYVNNNLISLGNRTLTINGQSQTFTTTGQIAGGGNLNFTNITMFASGSIAAALNLTNVNAHIGTSPGTLNVTGNYRMITGGTLNIELGGTTPGTGHDRLNITGTATLLGTLAVSVINNFCPTGDFTFMTYTSRAGDFTTKTGLDLGGGRVLTATAGPTAYTLSAPETCAANTSTDLASTPNPSVFGQSVAFTATVTSGGSAVTVGTVTFKEGVTTLAGPTALNATGQASFSTSSLSAGSHTITAEYNGATSFNASSGIVTQTVNKADTSTAVVSSADPSVFGQPVNFTATVSAVVPGAGTPGGTVQFKDNGSPIGAPVALAGGVASMDTAALAEGTHTITAEYGGDGNFNGSTGTVAQTVDTADTATTVASTLNPSVFDQFVNFTATVSAVAPGAGTPAGTVQFKDNGSPIGSPVALAGGSASMGTAALTGGTHSITAEYNGDDNFNASTGTLDQLVNGADTSTALTSSLNPSISGESVTFTATVTNATGSVTEGTVTFKEGATELAGPTAVGSDGQASFSTSALTAGDHTITAGYSGTDNFKPSSGTVAQTVTLAAKPVVAVTNQNDGTVSFIDAETNQVVNTVEVGKKPVAAAFFDLTSETFELPVKLYVTEMDNMEGQDADGDGPGKGHDAGDEDNENKSKGVTRALVGPTSPASGTAFDFGTGTLIDVGNRPEGLAINPAGSQIWVANRNDDAISIIDRASDAVLGSVPLTVTEAPTGKGKPKEKEVGRKPVTIAFSPDGNFAFVAGRNSDNVIVIDAATQAILASVEVGRKPVALAVAPDDSMVYAVNRNGNTVAVVDVSAPAAPVLLAEIAVGGEPEGVALLNDGTKLYVTSSETNSVWVFESLSEAPYLSLRSMVSVGKAPSGIAVTRSGSLASGDVVYVANQEDHTVSVIDAVTDEVMATIPVGRGPTGVASGLLHPQP